tara:strand:+ start:63 stop:707 length:645 start_codon:yes stop_codon:yes gene_type:complete
MNKNKIHSLWPIFVGEFHNPNHQEVKKDLIEFFKEYETKNDKSREGSENYDLFESQYFMHKEKNIALSKIINFIAEGFLAMTKNVNKAELDKVENKNTKLDVKIKNSWFIRYNKGGMVTPHDHGECSLSCVYYVQVGEDANINNGSTYFLRPFSRGSTHKDFAGIRYNRASQLFKAEEGKLLIWPSFMLHGSKPYTGEKNRIIISANADVDINK